MIHEQLQLWLYAAEETVYERLELPQRRLSCWVVSFVKQGRVLVKTPGAEHLAKAGDVMVHPPNQLFSEHAATPGVHQWLLLDAKDRSGLELLRRYPVPRVVTLTAPKTFEHHFLALQQSWDDASALRELRVFSRGLELLTLLLGDAEGVSRDTPLPEPADRFERVVQFMRDHLHEPLSRRTLAAKARLHPTHFDRAFRRVYGVTPMQMLRDMRFRRARQQLETTHDSLEVTAEACGFHDAAHLSRTFKARFGQSPGAYRDRVKSTKRSYLTLLQEGESARNNRKN